MYFSLTKEQKRRHCQRLPSSASFAKNHVGEQTVELWCWFWTCCLAPERCMASKDFEGQCRSQKPKYGFTFVHVWRAQMAQNDTPWGEFCNLWTLGRFGRVQFKTRKKTCHDGFPQSVPNVESGVFGLWLKGGFARTC